MIGKILIATLAAATLFIATGHAAIVSDGRDAATGAQSIGAMRTEGIRYDGIRAPSLGARLADATPARRLRF